MREQILLNQGWEFAPLWRDEFIQPGVGAEGFMRVNLPHMNKEIPYNYFDERTTSLCPVTAEASPTRTAGQETCPADFDGVMAYAEVYLNGKLVGSHKGYTPLRWTLQQG